MDEGKRKQRRLVSCFQGIYRRQEEPPHSSSLAAQCLHVAHLSAVSSCATIFKGCLLFLFLVSTAARSKYRLQSCGCRGRSGLQGKWSFWQVEIHQNKDLILTKLLLFTYFAVQSSVSLWIRAPAFAAWATKGVKNSQEYCLTRLGKMFTNSSPMERQKTKSNFQKTRLSKLQQLAAGPCLPSATKVPG